MKMIRFRSRTANGIYLIIVAIVFFIVGISDYAKQNGEKFDLNTLSSSQLSSGKLVNGSI